MKSQILLVALTSLCTSVLAQEPAKTRFSQLSSPMGQPEYDTAEHIVTPAFQNAIHPEDAAAGSNPTYDIIKSGRYYLTNDFKIAATTSGASLLRVNADNVTLDLNSKTITPSVYATQTNLVGITVNSKNNVTIMNGSIQCDDLTKTQRIVTGISLGSSTKTIKVQDVYINRALATGITGTSINDLLLANVTVNNISATAATNGVTLTTCKNIQINNCSFSNNTTSSGNCIGLNLSGCQDGTISDVIANSNYTTSTTNGEKAIGISLASTCQNLVFKNCTASNNRSRAQQTSAVVHSAGISISASPLNRFENCLANGNGTNSSDGIDHDVAGFVMSGASHSCAFINCEASRNICNNVNSPSAVPNAYGFKISSGTINNLYFENCSANANEGNSSAATCGNACGFYFSSINNSRLVNCQAHKNDSEDLGAYGFYMSSNTNNALVNCQAKGNIAAAATQSAVGFYSTSGTNNRFEKCLANGQTCSSAAGSLTIGTGAIGFNLTSETRSQIVDCEAVGNNIASGANSRAYGFYLGATATNCEISNSYAAYNTAGASGFTFGFYDGTAAGSFTSLWRGNVSVGHGKCLTSTELDGSFKWQTSSSEPVQVGTSTNMSLNYFFLNAGTGDNPQNVIHEVPKWNLDSLSTAVKMWENVSIY